ncbi:MAG: PKD domain-containing protein [Bacteroidetes bacterium]|nr:PKD domain-containing protein [Bacteroidota bacterium]
MKNKFLLLIIFIFFLSFVSKATHIVGGSLTYEQLGGSTYRVTLKLYRDCKAGSAAFPNPVTIEVRRSCGTVALADIVIPFPGASLVPPNIDTCAVNPGICLEEAVYTKVVSGLPPTAGGYDLFFSYCCRNSTLLNIVAPLSAGETWYAHIPDNGVVIANSSPKWVKPPPVFVCQGNNMFVDHSATDADGDSLVYSLYTPYTDLPAATWPGCVFTQPTVTWSSTYGANNPLDAATPNSLTISSTGIINGVPPILGQFVAGVKCEEWRNGVKIGQILRDFQFNVVNCPPVAVASFNSSNACAGTTINFTNTTTPTANTYLWNFGDGSPTTTVTSPSHTYPALGSYTVQLIINNGTPCADTMTHTVNISFVISDYISDAPNCMGLPINFTDNSSVDPGSSITAWNWNFGDGFTSTLQDPSHIYGAGATYNVSLVVTTLAGCKDTIVYPVTIQGSPIANAGGDTISCTNNSTITMGGTILNALGGQWIGGLGSSFSPSSSTLNPTYTPTAAAIASGADTLILYTTGNGFCPADTDQVIISFYPGPTINAGADIFVCKDTASVPVCAALTVSTGGLWATTGTGTFASPSSLCTTYIPSTADTAAGTVMLYVISTGNGNCIAASDSTTVTFTATPIAVITSGNSACASNPIGLNATVTTSNGIWTSSGTGSFAPSDTSLSGVYLPSPADDLAGGVTLIFTSTNNGGCRSNADTINITIIPSPIAAFSSVNACPQDTVVFTDASTSVGTIVGWSWNFGDLGTSILQDPTHIYGSGGPYIVSLIVTSNNGCVDTLTQTLNVFEKPVANFNANGICLDDGTVYTDMSTVGGGATITSWNWTFGDSSPNSTIQDPTHNFPSAGSYNTILIVQSSQGCIDSVTQVVNVLPGPGAAFTADDFTGNVNQTINFSDQSTNGPISWFWNFGDSSADSSSTLQNPTHIYGAGGYYDVCLIVTDINGCTDTICKTEIISMPPEVPTGFTPNGDGANDIFYVYGGPFKKLEFKIYNNWGELIH